MQAFARTSASLSLLSLLGGCATLINGHTQSLAVSTSPPGASCTVYRSGAVVATVNSTPGTVSVPRSHQALTINCAQDGYSQTLAYDPAHLSVAGAANLIGLPLSILAEPVDIATGANFYYPDTHVVLAAARDKQANE